jgi:hypothetical protein
LITETKWWNVLKIGIKIYLKIKSF